MTKKCKHEWYPVNLRHDENNIHNAAVDRVCRKCWNHQVVPSKWDPDGD